MMRTADIQRLLREQSFSNHDAEVLAKKIAPPNSKRERKLRKNDWDYVIAPLQKQIASLASGQSRWPKTHSVIYGPYLELCRKALRKIRAAQEDAATRGGLSIPEYAKLKGIPNDGMRWSNYVPANVKEQFMAAFDTLYAAHPKGKRLIPFETRYERTANDARWARMTLIVNNLIEVTKPEPFSAPLLDALYHVRDIVRTHDDTEVCPAIWDHLLPVSYRKQIKVWRDVSNNGLHPPAHFAAEHPEAAAFYIEAERALALRAQGERSETE